MDIFVPKFLWISKKLELTFISDKFSNIKSWPRGNVKPGSSGFLNPEVPDFNRYITIQPVTYPFTSHSLSHSLPDTNTVRERRFWGDSAIWSRISRIEGRLLVITIQRFRIHPLESISNPSHHEQRYKINLFARSVYLGLICSIPLVGHLHLDHSCYP